MHDLRLLSPLDFEALVRDLLQAEFNILLESFGPGKDGGIDFRYSRDGRSTVIQAKHYVNSTVRSLVASAKKEAAKVRKLRPSRYILATSLSISDVQKTKILDTMSGVPLKREDIFHQEDILNLLGRHPSVLRRHFKLWLTSTESLERIVHAGIYNRTDAELEVVKGQISRYVYNKSVSQAEAILEKRGSLIISGHPGVGKTTLMRMLMCLHIQQEWQVFVVEDLKEAMEVFSSGQKRLVVFDDFLGQVSLSTETVRDADKSIHRFLERVQRAKDLRFILTTRDYLLGQAQQQSERLNSPEVKLDELVLDVGKYTRSIRSQILFNHIYFSNLTIAEKVSLLEDDYFLEIIDHRNFSPRLIDHITRSDYLALQSESIREVAKSVLANPSVLWKTPYESHLSPDSRLVLQALFFADFWMSVDKLEASFFRLCSEVGVPSMPIEPLRFRRAMKPLEGSMVSISRGSVDFSNPGIKDFLKLVILDDGLFWSLLARFATLAEVGAAYRFYRPLSEKLGAGKQAAHKWLSALNRALATDASRPIRLLELAIQVTAGFPEHDDGLIPLIDDLVARVRAAPLDSSDETEFRHALEHAFRMRTEQRERIPSLDEVPQLTAELLRQEARYLRPSDIQELVRAIEQDGGQPELAASAGRDSLQEWLADSFDDDLREVESTSELNQLRQEVEVLAERFSIALTENQKTRIDLLHADLQEREEARAPESYSSVKVASPAPDFSDEEVRSLFSTISTSPEVL